MLKKLFQHINILTLLLYFASPFVFAQSIYNFGSSSQPNSTSPTFHQGRQGGGPNVLQPEQYKKQVNTLNDQTQAGLESQLQQDLAKKRGKPKPSVSPPASSSSSSSQSKSTNANQPPPVVQTGPSQIAAPAASATPPSPPPPPPQTVITAPQTTGSQGQGGIYSGYQNPPSNSGQQQNKGWGIGY